MVNSKRSRENAMAKDTIAAPLGFVPVSDPGPPQGAVPYVPPRPAGAVPVDAPIEPTNPADNGKGLVAIAKDAINRGEIAAEGLVGKILDPFQKAADDARTFSQFLAGDWSGVKTQGGQSLIPLSVGESLSQ